MKKKLYPITTLATIGIALYLFPVITIPVLGVTFLYSTTLQIDNIIDDNKYGEE